MTQTETQDPKNAICVITPKSTGGGNQTRKEDDMAFSDDRAQRSSDGDGRVSPYLPPPPCARDRNRRRPKTAASPRRAE